MPAHVCDMALTQRCVAGAVACAAMSLPDRGGMFKTGTLCCVADLTSFFKQISWLIAPHLLAAPWLSAFLMSFSLFDLNQPYWEDHAVEEVNTHFFLDKTVSLLSGKRISSCQHFCSRLDWALCSAVTPLQEASSSTNSRAICPGSRLATSTPAHPLSVCLWAADRVASPSARACSWD